MHAYDVLTGPLTRIGPPEWARNADQVSQLSREIDEDSIWIDPGRIGMIHLSMASILAAASAHPATFTELRPVRNIARREALNLSR
jgi:hypothetical protein